MPIHDWTKMFDGDFHCFHQSWIVHLATRLNSGILPAPFLARIEPGYIDTSPDIVVQSRRQPPPTARQVIHFERHAYARRANRIAIRPGRGEAVAFIQFVSPGHACSNFATEGFARRACECLERGVHLVIVDPLPIRNGRQCVHSAICSMLNGESVELPPRTGGMACSYRGGEVTTMFVEPFALGDPLPSLPIFLTEIDHVLAPLESSYMQAWDGFPLKDEMLANR